MTTVRALVYRMMNGILAPAYSIPSQSAFSLAQCVPAHETQCTAAPSLNRPLKSVHLSNPHVRHGAPLSIVRRVLEQRGTG